MNKNIKQIMTSFHLEGKITEQHAKEIEEILIVTMSERDELLKKIERLKRPCKACSGEGFIMEYDDCPGILVQNDCSRCKNTGIEPKL